MKIQKIGHCCLVIDVDGARVMTDPGSFTSAQVDVSGVDVVLITHEHGDHLHIESLKSVLYKNPEATVLCNSAVGKLLAGEKIPHTILEGTASTEVSGIPVVACDARHEEIFEELGQVQNTGYLVAGKLFYPGDSFASPPGTVDVLALPVAGPWCKIPDAIRYALSVKPRVAFPVHDGMIQKDKIAVAHFAPGSVLPKHGIQFADLKAGESAEF